MTDEVSLDKVLDEVGRFGKFQALNFFLVGLPILLSSAYSLCYVFTAGDLEYRCRIPECEGQKTTFLPSWLENAVPYEERDSHSRPKRCERYEVQNKPAEIDPVCPKELFNQSMTITCDDWVYETKEITIVNEWNITCEDNSWKLTLVGTVNNVGQFVGFPLVGFISDRIGRRTTLVLSTVGSGVMGIARSFAWRYEAFLVFEFLDPIFGSGIYPSGFILGLELVGASSRVLSSTLVSVFYAFGEALLGGIAWWLQDWRSLLRILYAPSLLFISYYWLLPESIRWLMTMGKNDGAKKLIIKAAKKNGIVLSEEKLKIFDVVHTPEGNIGITETKSSKTIMSNVLRSRILILRIVICSICWVTATFVFYGLSLTSVSVGGNKYSNFILMALVELPAYFVFYFTMDRFGRKTTLIVFMVLSGLSCFSFIFVPPDLDWLQMVLYMLGKFSITIAFTVLYVYTAEMFPTELRHFLLGICATGGRIGSIVAPQTPLLERYLQSFPLILFGSMSILAGILSLYFPETLHKKLPDTVREAEMMGKYVVAEEVEGVTELEDTAER